MKTRRKNEVDHRAEAGVKAEVLEEGVRVLVRLDEQGRPIAAIGPACWSRGGDAERISKLARNAAISRLQIEAHQKRKQAHDANRIAESTKTKRKKARDHWSHEWLESAHNKYPDYGADSLVQEARKLVALNKPEFDKSKRDEITEYRAKEYLKTARGK
jgi:hypothetical protein